jgi:regulator of nucleoside diphosphate kinase
MVKPRITISSTDHEVLTKIANGLMDTRPVLAEALLGELERARVVRANAVPERSVQMGSVVEYTTADGKARRVQLVYPAEADIAAGRISVLTPVGTALLGLSVGQSIDWVGNDGKQHVLNVIAVEAGFSPIPGGK